MERRNAGIVKERNFNCGSILFAMPLFQYSTIPQFQSLPSTLVPRLSSLDTRLSARAQHIYHQRDESAGAQHKHQESVPMEKRSEEMDIPAQVVSSKAPSAGPQNRPGDVVRREGPPGHL